jgi:hypothetical protein
MSILIHRAMVRALVRPYTWAVLRPKQNPVTRTIRAAWRAL